jgi:hypothetical protein
MLPSVQGSLSINTEAWNSLRTTLFMAIRPYWTWTLERKKDNDIEDVLELYMCYPHGAIE